MRILVILLVLVSVCALSLGTSYADSISSTLESKKIYVFAQVEVRNSDDNLVAYLEVKKIVIFDLAKLNQLLDENSEKIQKSTITLDGKNYEMIKGVGTVVHTSTTVVSKSVISNNQGDSSEILVQADHDGYPVVSGDRVTTTWTIIQPLS